ncbi:MAG TPA: hypothetical protein VMW50_03205 [Dehalococcoidia bacterium]|nr:hypothetical protein [Dehalococcoidia bacterium]
MPMAEIGLPVSSQNLKITHNGVDYNLVESVFTAPAVASTRIEARSSNAVDNTQNLVVYGIVAGAPVSESFALNGTTWVNGALDFTEVFEAYLDAVCAGTVSIRDSTAVVLGTIAIGRRVLSPDVFKRVGKDGNEVILPLCGGCEFVGEVLEGQFKKDWDADIVTFTARINGVVTGMLEMGGESDSDGTLRYGWINNHHPFVLMNKAELTVELEIPTADTTTPTYDIYFEFYIRDQKELTTPSNDPNFIMVRHFVDQNGLILQLYKEVGGVNTLLWDGSTADGDSIFSTTADQFWIFRFVFHDGHAGEAAPADDRHMHVYAKHGASRATAEAATEEELYDTVGTQASPYDISDLLFKVGYPAYQIITANEIWFGDSVGSGLEAISTYLRTSYPALFALKYDFTDADYGDGDVCLYDGDPALATSQRVYDEDHEFASDAYLQNGLLRLHVDAGVDGLKLYYWTGAVWAQPVKTINMALETDVISLRYVHLLGVNQVSPEKTSIRLKFTETAVNNNNFYIIMTISLQRGKWSLECIITNIQPEQPTQIGNLSNIPKMRWGYVGDGKIGDEDVSVSGTNTTFTDNFLLIFDDGDAVVFTVSMNKKPNSAPLRFITSTGGLLVADAFSPATALENTFWLSLTPFPLVANLFKEAEDATLGAGAARLFGEPAVGSANLQAFSAGADVGNVLTIIGDVGGVRTTDTITLNGVAVVPGTEDFDRVYILKLAPAAGNNVTVQDSLGNPIHIIPAGTTLVSNCVILDAITEYVRYNFTAGTDLPAGRYFAFFRVADQFQVADDIALRVTNATDGEQRGEQNSEFTVTAPAASAYGYYGEVFDILEEDVAGLNTIGMVVTKDTGGGNEIYVDYFLCIPIGDGRDWPGDLAHAALRTFTKPRRLYVR